MSYMDLGDAVDLAGKTPWEHLNSAMNPGETPEQKRLAEQARADRELENRMFAACFDAPAGRFVLDRLLDQTLRRSTWLAQLNLPAERIAIMGAAHEAQNALVLLMLKKAEEGGFALHARPAPPVKPKSRLERLKRFFRL
jgi:hypothetical protein